MPLTKLSRDTASLQVRKITVASVSKNLEDGYERGKTTNETENC